ncbi:MAG: glycosyltransferase [Chloroflexota bacterium]
MHILLLAHGSRGDVQPIMALGRGLQQAGYTVTVASGKNFKQRIERAGFHYAPFSADMQAVLNSPEGLDWIEKSSRNPAVGIKFMRDLMDREGPQTNRDLLEIIESLQQVDAVVSGLTLFPVTEAICEQRGILHVRAMFVPMKPTRHPEVSIFPYFPWGPSPLNQLAGYAGAYFLWTVAKDNCNTLREQLGLEKWGYRDYVRAWNHTPTLYGLSIHATPPADDWPGHNAVTGYWFWDDHEGWTPSPELLAFLQSGPPPVYVGFGSMKKRDPAGTLKIVIDALQQTGQRGIISEGWAKMGGDDLPETIFTITDVPHTWLFPQMAGVVHHGGAGTTAAGLRAGVPATIVAHMADQPYWGRRTVELGVAPTFIPLHEFTTPRLVAAIQRMVTDSNMKQQATALSKKIQAETGVSNAVAALHKMLKTPDEQ